MTQVKFRLSSFTKSIQSRKLSIIIGLIISLTALTSCQDLKKEEQLKKVNQLIATSDSIQKTFTATANDSIGKIITAVMDVELRIKNNYFSDTIDKNLARKVNTYKMIRKKLKPLGKRYNQIPDGCKEELIALDKLKKDIENGAGERGKYDEYLKFEENKVNQLKTLLDEFAKTQEEAISNFNKYHQEMYDFSISLLNKKK
jgi:hypothetical protein